jgi:hypothetical protein
MKVLSVMTVDASAASGPPTQEEIENMGVIFTKWGAPRNLA